MQRGTRHQIQTAANGRGKAKTGGGRCLSQNLATLRRVPLESAEQKGGRGKGTNGEKREILKRKEQEIVQRQKEKRAIGGRTGGSQKKRGGRREGPKRRGGGGTGVIKNSPGENKGWKSSHFWGTKNKSFRRDPALRPQRGTRKKRHSQNSGLKGQLGKKRLGEKGK